MSLRLCVLLAAVALRSLSAGMLAELRALARVSAKLLQKLAATATIEGRSRRSGGCALERPPPQITLAEMLAAGRPPTSAVVST